MTDREKIIAEIERLKKELYKQQDVRFDGSPIPVFDINAIEGMLKILEEIKGFINSLPSAEEQPSEDLEDAARNIRDSLYLKEGKRDAYGNPYFLQDTLLGAVITGAQWQKKKTINEACEWLLENVSAELVLSIEDKELIKDFIKNFKKAMEDE